MSNLFDFILSVISSIIGSLIVIYLIFWFLEPKIEISKYIIKSKNNNDFEFLVKLINNSKYPVNDIKVEMWKITQSAATSNTKGQNVSNTKIKLSTSEWLTIPKFRTNTEIVKTNFAPHCIKVKIIDANIEEILCLSNNQSLEFKVSVKHGLSNISKTFSMRFNDSSCIKEGRFVFGNSLETEKI